MKEYSVLWDNEEDHYKVIIKEDTLWTVFASDITNINTANDIAAAMTIFETTKH